MRPLKRILVGVVMVAIASPVHAQDAGTQSVFSLGVGSRAISLGRAYTSLADDASALYWNPAALRNVQGMQLMGMYMPLFGDFTGADYTYLGFVYPTLGAGAFGAGFLRTGTTFLGFDESSRPTGEQNYSESQILVSYAFERRSGWLLGTLATGASFKVSRQTVDPFSSTAPGFDLGFRWRPDFAQRFSLAVHLQDFASGDQKLDAAADRTYGTTMLGAGWTQRFENGSELRLMAQYDRPERGDARTGLGAEFAFAHYLSLRAGFDDGDVSFGLGVAVSRYGLDYAMLSRNEAGSSHPITFTVGFGQTLDEKRAAVEMQQAQQEQDAIRRAFDGRVAVHREAARKAAAVGDYGGALDEWKIVLEFVPDDDDAARSAAAAGDSVVARQAAAVLDVEKQAVVRTLFAQGLEFFNDANWVRARANWQSILKIDPGQEGAADYLRRTEEKIGDEIRVRVGRAAELEQGGRLTEAIAEWNNVAQYNPDDGRAREAIARIRVRIESAGQDLAAAQRRLRIVGLYDEALTDYNAGRYLAAIDKLNELARLQPDHEDARKLGALAKRRLTPLTDEEKRAIRQLYLKGMQLFSKDDYAGAIVEWQKILEVDPSNESVRGNIDEAEKRLKQLGERR